MTKRLDRGSLFWKAWFLSLAAKLALAAWLPMSSDEAYYWIWGAFPDWSYFDHPPMVGWLFALGRALDFVGQSSRWPGVMLGHLTFVIWRELIKPYLSDRAQALWLAFLCLSPLVGVGSLIVTPDVPFVFFWSLSVFAFLKALETRRTAWYAATGAALGLGFCSKYPIVLFVPSALLWLAFSGRWRAVSWARAGATFAFGLLFCAPVIAWNYGHGWASFLFQLEHGFDGGAFEWSWPVEYASGQLGILLPTTAWLALRGREPKEASWLRWFGWFPLAFFLYSSFKARVEANWPIAAYPALLSLAFLNRGRTRVVEFSVALWAVALAVVLSQVARPWIPVDPSRLKTSEFTKFDAAADEAARIQAAGRDVRASTYQMASAISYRNRALTPKLPGLNRRDFFDSLEQAEVRTGKLTLIVEGHERLEPSLKDAGFCVLGSRAFAPGFAALELEVNREKDCDR